MPLRGDFIHTLPGVRFHMPRTFLAAKHAPSHAACIHADIQKCLLRLFPFSFFLFFFSLLPRLDKVSANTFRKGIVRVT